MGTPGEVKWGVCFLFYLYLRKKICKHIHIWCGFAAENLPAENNGITADTFRNNSAVCENTLILHFSFDCIARSRKLGSHFCVFLVFKNPFFFHN